MILRTDPFPYDSFEDRFEEDPGVIHESDVAEIFDIQFKLRFPADGVSAVDLSPTGQTRSNAMSEFLSVVV